MRVKRIYILLVLLMVAGCAANTNTITPISPVAPTNIAQPVAVTAPTHSSPNLPTDKPPTYTPPLSPSPSASAAPTFAQPATPLAWLFVPEPTAEEQSSYTTNKHLYRSDNPGNRGLSGTVMSINGQGIVTPLARNVRQVINQFERAPLFVMPIDASGTLGIVDPLTTEIVAHQAAEAISPDRTRIVRRIAADVPDGCNASLTEETNLATGITRTYDLFLNRTCGTATKIIGWTDQGIYTRYLNRRNGSSLSLTNPDADPPERKVQAAFDGLYAPMNAAFNISAGLVLKGGCDWCTLELQVVNAEQPTMITSDSTTFLLSLSPHGAWGGYVVSREQAWGRIDIGDVKVFKTNDPTRSTTILTDTAVVGVIPEIGANRALLPEFPFLWSPDEQFLGVVTTTRTSENHWRNEPYFLQLFRTDTVQKIGMMQLPSDLGSVQVDNRGQVLLIQYEGDEATFIAHDISSKQTMLPVPLGTTTPIIIYVP